MDTPALQSVLDALDDPVCRELIKHLEGTATVSELSEAANVPLSTTYRKLDRLEEASLLKTETEIRRDGHHTTLYHVDFERVVVALDEDREFEVAVERPPKGAEERLAALWSEVRKET
ncbi:ArsR/SmtB family transcription factor [Halomarina rubra]|uniref:ArsR/SmtB family transcription factor n=1 Tax=Halomarina rubra TaxID=2071873 RepID=A0ABD6AWV3_9EURY|nr:helix-turn-helix domain-containing protein [Halomarina rubra]